MNAHEMDEERFHGLICPFRSIRVSSDSANL